MKTRIETWMSFVSALLDANKTLGAVKIVPEASELGACAGKIVEAGEAFVVRKPIENVSDGYHTFAELYDHRHALFLALLRATTFWSWKSRKHNDGSYWDGWFICGLDLPAGTISYHLPDRLWEVCPAQEVEIAPKWDGHTPNDVIDRLFASFLEGEVLS